jgi:hypothetical protein
MSTTSDAQPSACHHRFGVRLRIRRRRAVRHQHAQQLFGSDGRCHEIRNERRVDPPGQGEHRTLEAGLSKLAANEALDDALGDRRVDRKLIGQLEQRDVAVPGSLAARGRHRSRAS